MDDLYVGGFFYAKRVEIDEPEYENLVIAEGWLWWKKYYIARRPHVYSEMINIISPPIRSKKMAKTMLAMFE